MSDLSKVRMIAHLSWATWAIRSQSLICLEWPERFAHICSFVLSDLSKLLTVAHLNWVKWANEQIPSTAFQPLFITERVNTPQPGATVHEVSSGVSSNRLSNYCLSQKEWTHHSPELLNSVYEVSSGVSSNRLSNHYLSQRECTHHNPELLYMRCHQECHPNRAKNSLTVFLSESLAFCEKMSKWAICSKKWAIRSLAHFWWVTWANRSWLLIFCEGPEQIAHGCSFLVNNFSNLFTSLIFGERPERFAHIAHWKRGNEWIAHFLK